MVGKIIAILLTFWFLGIIFGISGAAIHLLLLIAGMLLLGKMLEPRPLR